MPRRSLLSLTLLLALVPPMAGSAFAGVRPASLEASCANEILEQPEIGAATVQHAGNPNQSIAVSQLHRIGARMQWQVPATGGFQDRDPQSEIRQTLVERGWPGTASVGNKCGSGGILSLNTYRKPMLYWSPGSRFRFRLRLRMLTADSDKNVRTRIKTYAITEVFRGHVPARVRHEENLSDCD